MLLLPVLLLPVLLLPVLLLPVLLLPELLFPVLLLPVLLVPLLVSIGVPVPLLLLVPLVSSKEGSITGKSISSAGSISSSKQPASGAVAINTQNSKLTNLFITLRGVNWFESFRLDTDPSIPQNPLLRALNL